MENHGEVSDDIAWWLETSYQGSANLGCHFNGCLADIRVWNVARSEEDIRRDMKRRLTGNEAGLVGYWRFDEGQGNVVKDSSVNHNDGRLSCGSQDRWERDFSNNY